VVIVQVGTVIFQRDDIQTRLQAHFEETIGSEGAKQLTDILNYAITHEQRGWGWFIGTGMLLLGATGALGELQTALNRAWGVEPDPKQGGVRGFIIKRLLSLALLLGIAVLLIASVVLSGLLATFSRWIDDHPNAFVNSHADSDVNSHADSDSNGNADANSNGYANSDSNGNADANGHADGHAHADSNAVNIYLCI